MTEATKRSLSIALRVGSVVVLLGLLALAIVKLDWREVAAALAGASLPLVVAAAALNFVNLACKAARWKVMLAPIAAPRSVGFFRLYYYLIVSYAASAVLPARAGEALRVLLLRRRDQIAVADSVGVVVLEKLFEVLGLLTMVLPLPLLMVLPRWAEVSIWAFAIGGFVVLALAIFLARRLDSDGAGAWHKLARGLQTMRSPSRFALAVGLSVLAFVIDAGEIWLVLRALGIDVHWATPALVLLGGNLAIAVPLTPGQVGILEAGIVAGLAIVHVPPAQALAFALVYHVMQLLPIVLVGLSGFRLMAEAKAIEHNGELASATPAEVIG